MLVLWYEFYRTVSILQNHRSIQINADRFAGGADRVYVHDHALGFLKFLGKSLVSAIAR